MFWPNGWLKKTRSALRSAPRGLRDLRGLRTLRRDGTTYQLVTNFAAAISSWVYGGKWGINCFLTGDWFKMTQIDSIFTCLILLAKFLRVGWSLISKQRNKMHVVPSWVFHPLRVGRNQFARTQPITWKWRHCFFQGPVEALQAGGWDKWTAA
jgi:hypothetical protein